MQLAINATNIGPQGGINGLLAYLRAWEKYDMLISLYASDQYIISEVEKEWPDIHIVPFGMGMSYWMKQAFLYAQLGRKITNDGADVLMSTNKLTPGCKIPQLVHHRNAYLFLNNNQYKLINSTIGIKYIVKRYAAISSLKKSHCNVFISDYLKKIAEQCVPESECKNFVIYNGIHQTELKGLDDHRLECLGEPIICALQTPAKHKDSQTLIKMLGKLTEIAPDIPWRLKIAGGKNESWEEIKQVARRIGVIDRIEFLGYLDREQILALLRTSMCLVFTSLLEGFGNPPIEAMCSGCPVIASDCTAIPEVVGDAGLLVSPGNEDAFADAVLKIYTDKELREKLITRGLERVQTFLWEKSATKMYELLQSIIPQG